MFTKILMQMNLAQYVSRYFMRNKKKLLCLIVSFFFIKNEQQNGQENQKPALIVELK